MQKVLISLIHRFTGWFRWILSSSTEILIFACLMPMLASFCCTSDYGLGLLVLGEPKLLFAS